MVPGAAGPLLQQAAWGLAAARLAPYATGAALSSGRPRGAGCGARPPLRRRARAAAPRAARATMRRHRNGRGHRCTDADACSASPVHPSGLSHATSSSSSGDAPGPSPGAAAASSSGRHAAPAPRPAPWRRRAGWAPGALRGLTLSAAPRSSSDPSQPGGPPGDGPKALYEAGLADGTYRADPLQAVTVDKLQVGLGGGSPRARARGAATSGFVEAAGAPCTQLLRPAACACVPGSLSAPAAHRPPPLVPPRRCTTSCAPSTAAPRGRAG
jgi:hypothetical protein